MCSGFWDIDWKSFYDEEASFYEELKKDWIIEDFKKPENVDWVVGEGKKSLEEIIPLEK